MSDAKAQVSYDYDTGRITTFLISTQHQEDTSVMETAGKIKNDNMSDQDFYKFKFVQFLNSTQTAISVVPLLILCWYHKTIK